MNFFMDCRVLFKQGLSLCVVMAFLLGCGGKGVKPAGGDPEVLYREGLVRFNKRDYSEALKKFQELKSNFPDHPPDTLWAELKVGDCHFLMKEYVEAVAAYEEFKKMHPTHEEMPYVQYQIGMSHYKQMLSLDRDQTATKKALSNFEYLIANFPPSLFTEKAKEKVDICKKRLADHELYVGRYYYRKKNYEAASRRFQQLLANFPGTANEDEILLLLGSCYLELDQEARAGEVLNRLVNEYPQSASSKEAKRLLGRSAGEKKTTKKTLPENGSDAFPFTKYEEEPRQSVPYQSPLTLPIRKVNPHPRVEMELEFTPEQEKRTVISPTLRAPSEGKGNEKKSSSTDPGEGEWVDQREPIDIVSDEVETYTRENRAIFRGNVVVRQKDVTIYSDSIEAVMVKEGKGIDRVIASGNVILQQGERVARCQNAVFDNNERSILLTGDPEVSEGENRVSGETIVVDLSQNRVEVKGGLNRRSKTKIYPDKGFKKFK